MKGFLKTAISRETTSLHQLLCNNCTAIIVLHIFRISEEAKATTRAIASFGAFFKVVGKAGAARRWVALDVSIHFLSVHIYWSAHIPTILSTFFGFFVFCFGVVLQCTHLQR